MRFGFVQPFGTAADIVEAAVLAEQSGWDALFVAETVWGVDAWVALSAAAMRTSRIRLGTMLTPLPRHKPWDVASKVVTLDHLSGGRAQLTVGLGALHEGWLAFEPETTQAERAALLDEGLAVYDGLMRGQPFTFDGEHYRVRPTDFFLPIRRSSGRGFRSGWSAPTAATGRDDGRCGGPPGGTVCCPR